MKWYKFKNYIILKKKKERKEKKKKVDACSDLVCRLPQHQIKNKTTADVGCLFLLTVGDDSLLFLLLWEESDGSSSWQQ